MKLEEDLRIELDEGHDKMSQKEVLAEIHDDMLTDSFNSCMLM
jgi:hypothetical protein